MLHRREVLQEKRLPSIHPTARLFKSLLTATRGKCLALPESQPQVDITLPYRILSAPKSRSGSGPTFLMAARSGEGGAGKNDQRANLRSRWL